MDTHTPATHTNAYQFCGNWWRQCVSKNQGLVGNSSETPALSFFHTSSTLLSTHFNPSIPPWGADQSPWFCACVCVCVREGEKERERDLVNMCGFKIIVCSAVSPSSCSHLVQFSSSSFLSMSSSHPLFYCTSCLLLFFYLRSFLIHPLKYELLISPLFLGILLFTNTWLCSSFHLHTTVSLWNPDIVSFLESRQYKTNQSLFFFFLHHSGLITPPFTSPFQAWLSVCNVGTRVCVFQCTRVCISTRVILLCSSSKKHSERDLKW